MLSGTAPVHLAFHVDSECADSVLAISEMLTAVQRTDQVEHCPSVQKQSPMTARRLPGQTCLIARSYSSRTIVHHLKKVSYDQKYLTCDDALSSA